MQHGNANGKRFEQVARTSLLCKQKQLDCPATRRHAPLIQSLLMLQRLTARLRDLTE